jgi:hypothetical protein
MTGPVEVSIAFYQRILPIFPPALRSEFGEAMVSTFEEQARSAWHERSFAGLLLVWKDVAQDLVTVVLPYAAACIVVPALTLLCSSVIFSLMLWGVAPIRTCFK